MICCGFGHREVFESIREQVEAAVVLAIQRGCNYFYTGAMGEFDSLFSDAVRVAKNDHPNIKLICIKPYLTTDINESKEYYTALYDEIIVPDELAGIHYKAAIKARNRWIVDHSDIVIGYTIRDYGGAYLALKYAEKVGKEVIII